MSILKNSKCKDRVAYMEKCRAQEVEPDRDIASRFVIVIDEAAEMFLAGTHASASEIQKARVIVSQIARQGRAVGVHLIVATQRPDTKALDPQVKANLTGVLCFQMANDASSVVVLGCGRATDLPAVPGRAIWKTGSGLTEVQVPHMSAKEADDLLASSRIVREPGTPTEQTKMGTIAV
jgi:S-DNA-T family DNA segregation ATPase FtsK/SpoIIIE